MARARRPSKRSVSTPTGRTSTRSRHTRTSPRRSPTDGASRQIRCGSRRGQTARSTTSLGRHWSRATGCSSRAGVRLLRDVGAVPPRGGLNVRARPGRRLHAGRVDRAVRVRRRAARPRHLAAQPLRLDDVARGGRDGRRRDRRGDARRRRRGVRGVLRRRQRRAPRRRARRRGGAPHVLEGVRARGAPDRLLRRPRGLGTGVRPHQHPRLRRTSWGVGPHSPPSTTTTTSRRPSRRPAGRGGTSPTSSTRQPFRRRATSCSPRSGTPNASPRRP